MNAEPVRSLDARYYTDPAIFALEGRQLFGRMWLCIGRDEDLPEMGTYLTQEVGGEKLLVVRGDDATLLLPRDKRVLRHATPPEVVEALAGVRLGPDELRALVSGCVAPGGRPTAGRSYPGGWGVVDLDSGATAFLRQRDGRWRIEVR